MLLLRYVIFLMLWFSQSAYAEPYERFLDSILNNGHTVKLVDGSLWEVKGNLKEIEKWQHGDPIVFDPEFCLKNLRTKTSIKISNCGYQAEVYRAEAISFQENCLLLSDHSIWRVSCQENRNFLYHWKSGDKVIIFTASDLIGCYLINLDQPFDKRILYANYCSHKEKTPYLHLISNIALEGLSLNHISIQLDNGFIWKVKNSFQATYFEEITRNWRTGDEVSFYCAISEDGGKRSLDFYLANLRTLCIIPVKYKEQKERCVSYTIEKIEIYTSYLFFDHALITLNDGSCWKIQDPIIQSWEEGNHVLICRDFRSNDRDKLYTLINSDLGASSSWIFQIMLILGFKEVMQIERLQPCAS